MHVVLISIHPAPSLQAVPLAAAFLKSFLEQNKELSGMVSVSILELTADQPVEKCTELVLGLEPDAVGLSLYEWNRRLGIELAAALHAMRPKLAVIAGGPEATADSAKLLENSDIDYIVVGEGEESFCQLISLLATRTSPVTVNGVVSRALGLSQYVERVPVEPLDKIPSPYLAGVLEASGEKTVLWQLSRGCSFGCDFCFDHKGKRKVRQFSLERVREELDFFVRKQVAQVYVLDSTFNQDMRRAKEILRLMVRAAPHIHFHFELRSEFLNRELAELFAQLTCSLQIGLQSADPKVQKKVGRSFDADDFVAKVALLNDSGAVFGFDLIYGLPGDTLSGFMASLDFALSLYPNHLDIFPLAVLPGTKLAANAGSIGLHYLEEPPYTLLHSLSLSADELLAAARLAAACDIFYNRGKAVAWFNPVVSVLGMGRTQFLRHFEQWFQDNELIESRYADDEIWQLQRKFLTFIFKQKKMPRLLPLALDLADYHHNFAAALLAPQPQLPTDRRLRSTDLLQVPLSLQPSARIGTFNFEILDILEVGEIDLQEFVRRFRPRKSYAVIYPRADEVLTESLMEQYFLLLSRLDGRTPALSIVQELGLSADEASSFLEFAIAEGIAALPPEDP